MNFANWNLKMHENSLFAVLLRSPFWISFLVAGALFAIARLFLEPVYAIFAGLPFFVIGCIALWKQLQAPSAAKIAKTVDTVKVMSWNDFAEAVEAGFRKEGYAVTRLKDSVADFELAKANRTAVVSAKRWKAARTGIETLRELHAVREAREAHESIYIVAGDITDNAKSFAAQHRMRIVSGPELVRLLPKAKA